MDMFKAHLSVVILVDGEMQTSFWLVGRKVMRHMTWHHRYGLWCLAIWRSESTFHLLMRIAEEWEVLTWVLLSFTWCFFFYVSIMNAGVYLHVVWTFCPELFSYLVFGRCFYHTRTQNHTQSNGDCLNGSSQISVTASHSLITSMCWAKLSTNLSSFHLLG